MNAQRVYFVIVGVSLLLGGCGAFRKSDPDTFSDVWSPGGGERNNKGVWIEDKILSDDKVNERLENACRAYVENHESHYDTPVHLDSYRHNGRVWVLTYNIEDYEERHPNGSFLLVPGCTVDVWMDAYRGKVIAITRRNLPEREEGK